MTASPEAANQGPDQSPDVRPTERPDQTPAQRAAALRLHRALMPIWSSDQRFRGWLTTSNNNDIGTLFLIVATSFFLIGGILAMLIRAQLATPGS
ncbi:MAG: hypothetical protein B7Y02_10835, partial [Rhodobacterales bacterium 17-64-5]